MVTKSIKPSDGNGTKTSGILVEGTDAVEDRDKPDKSSEKPYTPCLKGILAIISEGVPNVVDLSGHFAPPRLSHATGG